MAHVTISVQNNTTGEVKQCNQYTQWSARRDTNDANLARASLRKKIMKNKGSLAVKDKEIDLKNATLK